MYDLAVVGLGAMGSAVAWHASRLGTQVIGFDRHHPPHSLGSSHAETRITRLAVGEGDQYLPFVARSHELWSELEAISGQRLFFESGGHIVSVAAEHADRWTDFTAQTARIAERAGIPYEVFDGDELQRRQPAIEAPPDASVGFEPTAGIVMCERAIEAQHGAAAAGGVELRFDTTVDSIEPGPASVAIRAAGEIVDAERVVLAAGAWTPGLVPASVGERLTVTRQVAYWFEADDLDAWSVDRFPFVMWIAGTIDEYVGVFPVPPTTAIPGVKILGEQFVDSTTPESVARTVTADEAADFHRRLIAPRFAGIADRVVRAEVCLYTSTPDDHFLIEQDPRSDRVVVMSPCSGHGFKHSAALGEAVAQCVMRGQSDLDLSPFGLD